MNKKKIFTLALFSILVFLSGCGGGGGGSVAHPGGTTEPAVVRLTATQNSVQIGSTIYLRAKVLDGNGKDLKGVTVNFANVSSPLTGTLSAASAVTDSNGIATVSITSLTAGFATIEASVSTLSDRKTVQFTTTSVSLVPTISLNVDSVPGNGIFNEPSDLTLFENSSDDTVTILATVLNGDGTPAVGTAITWGADSSQVVITPSTSTTNAAGQAIVTAKVTPSAILNAMTFVTVTASASNGASNLVTLFLKPVTVSPVLSTLTADPTAVNPSGTSALTAVVQLNTGGPAPDGTTVNFTSTCGTVTPFEQTSGGVATGTFTAPLTLGTCTVTATAGGVTIGSVPILVNTALKVIPSTVSVSIGGSASVQVFGGLPNYHVISGSPATATVSPATLTASGQSFIISGVANGSTTITVVDATGSTVTVAVTVGTTSGPLQVIPTSQTLSRPAPGATATYSILGGTGPYTAFSSNPGIVTVSVSGTTVTARVVSVPSADTTITISVFDSQGATKTATLVLLAAPPLNVIPGTATIAANGGSTTFEISGGLPPYQLFLSSDSLVTVSISGNSFTVTGKNNGTGSVTITVADSSSPTPQQKNVTVTVQ